MHVIIHDLNNEQFELLFPELNNNSHIIFDNGTIKSCIGCFGCWIKTPGKCVIKDGYDNIGELFSKADKVIVISKCFYGGFSPFVKNVLDRSIAYMLPFFRTVNKETHHKQRYDKSFKYCVHFYGENITEPEKETACSLVKANSINFCSEYVVSFSSSVNELVGEVDLI